MSWRVYQRIFEVAAVIAMMAGIVLMWMQIDSQHNLIYVGFVLLSAGKLTEALNLIDPNFKIIKVMACFCIFLLVILNLFYHVRSITYILIPLAVYYALHYRWMFQHRKV